MNEFQKTYENFIKRSICHYEPVVIYEDAKSYMYDVISESVFPKIWQLFTDIRSRTNSRERLFSYDKSQLLKITDSDWKYYERLKILPDDFSLTIVFCRDDEIQRYSGINVSVHGRMMEFIDPRNWKHEHIWIDSDYDFSDEEFDGLLMHEFGHVWTFSFGTNEEHFSEGQISGNGKSSRKLDRFQIDVLNSFYGGNMNALKNDYDYVLSCHGNETFASEFIPIVDEIIEFLVNWYLDNEADKLELSQYLNMIMTAMSNPDDFSGYADSIIPELAFIREYKNGKLSSYKRNCIRRLMLIFAFGNEEQKEKFREEVRKELSDE